MTHILGGAENTHIRGYTRAYTIANKMSVQECLVSYLTSNGETHFEKLINETSSKQANVLKLFKNLSGSQRFHFFKNSDVFTIGNDGYVTSTANNVAQYLINILQESGWMHHLKLTDSLTNSDTDFEDYFKNWSDSSKHSFFRNNPTLFVIIRGYVFLPLDGGSYDVEDGIVTAEGDDLEKDDIEETVLRSLAMILNEKSTEMHYSTLLDNLTDDDVFEKFSSEYERCLFFAKHPSWFSITLDKRVNLNPCKKNEPLVIDFLVTALMNSGWLHHRMLENLLQKSSTGAEDYFNSFDESKVFWFFKDRPLHFKIANNGYVYLPAKTENEMINHLETKWMSPLLHFPNATKPIKLIEHDSVTAFLVEKVQYYGMHFKNLINELSNSSLNIKDYFKGLTDYHLCLFFKKHKNFSIDIHGDVTLSKKGKSVTTTSSVWLNVSTSVERSVALQSLQINLHGLLEDGSTIGSTEKGSTIGSTEGSTIGSTEKGSTIGFTIGFTEGSTVGSTEKGSTIGSTEGSTIGSTKSDDSAGKEASNVVFQSLSESGSMPYNNNFATLAIKPPESVNSSIDNRDKEVVDYLTKVLKSSGSMLYTRLIETVSSSADDNIKNYFLEFTLLEEFGFFKVRSSHFDINSKGLVSLPVSKVSSESPEEKTRVSEQKDDCVQTLDLQDEETADLSKKYSDLSSLDDVSLSSTYSSDSSCRSSFATAPIREGEMPGVLGESIGESQPSRLFDTERGVKDVTISSGVKTVRGQCLSHEDASNNDDSTTIKRSLDAISSNDASESNKCLPKMTPMNDIGEESLLHASTSHEACVDTKSLSKITKLINLFSDITEHLKLSSKPCDSKSYDFSNSLQQIILESNSLVLTLQNLTTLFDDMFKTFVACDNVEERKVMASDISESLGNIKTIYENFKLRDLVKVEDCKLDLADCAIIQQRKVADVEKEVAKFLVEFLTDVNYHLHYETLFIHLKHSQLFGKTSILSLFAYINNQQFKQFLCRYSDFCVDSQGMVTLRQNKHMNEGH